MLFRGIRWHLTSRIIYKRFYFVLTRIAQPLTWLGFGSRMKRCDYGGRLRRVAISSDDAALRFSGAALAAFGGTSCQKLLADSANTSSASSSVHALVPVRQGTNMQSTCALCGCQWEWQHCATDASPSFLRCALQKQRDRVLSGLLHTSCDCT